MTDPRDGRPRDADADGDAAGMKKLAKLLSMLGAEARPPVEHKFWKTQPVVQPGESGVQPAGAIEPSVPPERVSAAPLPLPADFVWTTVDVDDDKELAEVYELLSNHYVEDDDATMRFKYSAAFLRWALRHPGYDRSWHVGVRVKATNKLVAFIAGIPQELRVRESSRQVVEINFLCVHKKLRSKRMAPVLIKEITRRCHLRGVFQAIYTGGQVLPTPVSCARYYHRTLDAAKLVDIGFSAVPHGMTLAKHAARYALPEAPALPGLRAMRREDVPAVGRLLRRYMARFDMAPRFTDAEVAHLFADDMTEPVVYAYVVERDGRITDFVSFYNLPSSVLDNAHHATLHAAYMFYYATEAAFEAPPPDVAEDAPSAWAQAIAQGAAPWQANECSKLSGAELADERGVAPWHTESRERKDALKARLHALLHDMLVLAKSHGFDVVNCLTVMDNALVMHDLKFGAGDGFLRFYLFNWRVPPVAGGLGSRQGEADEDPAAQEDVPRPPKQFGSGNGVVMV